MDGVKRPRRNKNGSAAILQDSFCWADGQGGPSHALRIVVLKSDFDVASADGGIIREDTGLERWRQLPR